MKAIDLFCGAGGFSLGLKKAGFNIKLALDNCEKVSESYKKNFSHPFLNARIETLLESINSTDCRNVDLVVGGPPCQGFSVQRIGAEKDSRNSLVMKFASFIVRTKPRFFLMENVPGLIGKRGADIFSRFIFVCERGGYTNLKFQIVDSSLFGVPQKRKRLFVCGTYLKTDLEKIFCPPNYSSKKTAWSAICNLPRPGSKGSSNDPLHRLTKLSKRNLERLRYIPPGGGMIDLPQRLRVNCHKSGADKIGHRFVYGRLNPNEPANTITARFDSFTRGRFAHPFQNRNITLREGARLQTFPDTHIFCGTQEQIAAQIGNAVPPQLAFIICKRIRVYLVSAGF